MARKKRGRTIGHITADEVIKVSEASGDAYTRCLSEFKANKNETRACLDGLVFFKKALEQKGFDPYILELQGARKGARKNRGR